MTPEKERFNFSERLRSALTGAGYSPSPTLLAREFNLRTKDKTVSMFASRKWLLGESIPTQEKMQVLADWLGVSVQWLRFGIEDGVQRQSGKTESLAKAADRSILADYQRLTEMHRSVIKEMITVLLKAEQKRPARVGR